MFYPNQSNKITWRGVTAKKIKILLVDDSAFMRLLITDILSEDKGLEVVGSAVNGKEAAQKVAVLQPDMVVLDMNMGEYDGTYAVKKIMKENPLPILILSSVGNSDLQPIFDALKFGAVDYMNKPSRANSKMRAMNVELINKIKSVARAKPKVLKTPSTTTSKHHFSGKSNFEIIAIGASTGGPSAIEKVITSLPVNLIVPVIIVQHMPANFIQPFVQRLNSLSPLNIVLGTKSMVPRPGMIIVAPGNANMVMEKDTDTNQVHVGFNPETFREYNNPSINALMLSVAETYGSKAIGVILTGMGKDGAKGLKAIRDKGGFTIAQNKESSVIYGMPKAAVDSNAVSEVLDIKEIGNFIVNHL